MLLVQLNKGNIIRQLQQIKVISCTDTSYWYNDKINQILTSEYFLDDCYWCREGGRYNAINFILEQDAEIITKELNE